MISSDMYECLYNTVRNKDLDAAFIKYVHVTEILKAKDILNSAVNYKECIKWDTCIFQLNNKLLSEDDKKYLMVTPIGGVVCGLWRKSLIIENGLYFPENIKYEDNYWETVIKCYLNKVEFIDHICYFYRQNPTSTVHLINAKHNEDRLIIEEMLIDYFVKYGIYKKYESEIEYIFIFRRTFNTYYMLINRYDFIDTVKLKQIIQDLNSRFPNWYDNKYYKAFNPCSKKTREYLISKFPQFFIMIAKIRKCIKLI